MTEPHQAKKRATIGSPYFFVLVGRSAMHVYPACYWIVDVRATAEL